MGIKNAATQAAIKTALKYLEKNPEENLPKLMAWVDKFAGEGPDSFPAQRDAVRAVVNNPDSNMYRLIMNLFHDVDGGVLRTFFTNFILNANLIGWPVQEEYRKKYGCNIPWAILLDPTSACNLHCTGCWAAEYGNRLNLSLEEIDSIIRQGKEMGVYLYIYTGGEPLVRKKDLITLCERLHRRGEGTYQKVIAAMELLRRKRLVFGLSCCYTSANLDSISSDAFLDQMVEWGAKFVWYFHYMPVGNDAAPELLPTPEQREQMYHQIRHIRETKPIFAMDFQNDGEYVGGCIAGGRRYLHINANGDIDPCVFIHYSDRNIRSCTLLEALQSPLFMAYHDGQPFNENHLRPCPMLENPERLRELVKKTGAHSTDLQSPESADHLCDKCVRYAECWKPTAERLWQESYGKAD